MLIMSRLAKDRTKVTLLHGRSKIKVTIARDAEWQLLRDRLDASASAAMAESRTLTDEDPDEAELLFRAVAPVVQLSLTCDLTHLTDEREFEECLTTIHRVMEKQHPDDVRLLVLVSSKLRGRFDSIEWKHREACAAGHQTTLAMLGQWPEAGRHETK